MPTDLPASPGWSLVFLGAAILTYTYALYPLLIALLPARPCAPALLPPPRLASIVIAARGAGARVAAKAAHLLETVTIPCEVVVVLDGPDLEAAASLAALGDARVRVVQTARTAGKAAALNEAVAAAEGDVLVFTDVRQRISPGSVERLAHGLRSETVGVVAGLLELSRTGGRRSLIERYWSAERWLRSREARWDSAVGASGALYAMRRELWLRLPAGLILDDVWVPMSVVAAGRRVAFEPEAVALDVPIGDDAVEFARKVRTLTGNYQLLLWMPSLLNPLRNRIWWQFVSHKVLRLLTPAAVLLVVLGGLLLAGRWAATLAAALAAGAALAWWSPRLPARLPGAGLLRMGRTALLLQLALILALAHALRRNWDVWSSPGRPTLEGVRAP